ncbi:hypothetical protein GCM10007167_23400 [Vulcaniibacterium thermophilum]|uniref:Zeta toxin n=2 Tax=Vulcaniibacterium thermophilum TaxID=1169913 RepID=A0A918Z8Z0_9GAMM|nr:hypothetical protein GCM10007167_23400 [Vulcaniibacterium thermophilum]
MSGDLVAVDPDELRKHHPSIQTLHQQHPYTWPKHTHPDASQWADELLDAVIDGRKNLIYDTTLANDEWGVKVVKRLQAAGYDVEVRAVAAHRLESELGVNERFADSLDRKGHGRYVPAEARDAIYAKLPRSLDTIHAKTGVRVRLFDREGAELYDSRTDPRPPGAALEQVREARTQAPRLTRQLRDGWREQVGWHRELPQALEQNPRVSADVAQRLLAERAKDGIVPRVEDTARQAAELDHRVRIAPRIRAGAALGVAGIALDLYDAAQTQREAQHLRAQGNDTAADSHLVHFGTRTVGGVTGAGLGFAAGAAAGVQTGPGLLFTGAIGSAVGAFAGEKLADEWDGRRIYRQTDREGRTWTFDPDRPGLGWHREAAIDDRDDGLDNARAGIVRAAPALADELDYKATAVSLELKLGAPSVPRDPFAQPAADGDTPSSRPSPWVRDADTGQWTRVVYGPFVERGMTPRQTETATPERAAELDRQAAAIVLENARLAPAALAARYEDAYLRHGWAAHGPMPEAVTRARSDFDTLLGSDGNRYRRGEDGEWRHDGLLSDRIARGNLKHELEATREVLQATLPPRQAHAPLSAAAVPRSEDEAVRDALRGAYAHAGVAVDEKALSAGTQAVRAALAAHRLAAGDAAVQLRRDGDGRYGPDSGIAILARQPDGELRIIALVRAEDLARARQASEAPAMREPAPPATTPVSPPPMPSDLRDPLHPGHAAYRQSLGHVHRMEASHGIASGPHSEGLAAAVAVAVEREGLRVQRLDLDRASGQVFAVERGPYPEFTERRVPIDTRDALSAGFEAHARQWLLARSPHYADACAPPPERTPEATAALARLSPQDRALFERIRRDVPAAIADDAVAQAMLEAKRNGIDRAEAVDRTMLVGDRLWVAGNVPGLRASVDLAAPAPPLMQTLQDSHAFDQQHERERAHEAEQRIQSATAHRLMA